MSPLANERSTNLKWRNLRDRELSIAKQDVEKCREQLSTNEFNSFLLIKTNKQTIY